MLQKITNNINIIKYFNILFYIGFLSASVLSFKSLLIYIIFLVVSIVMLIFSFYKKEVQSFKYIVIFFIILYGVDIYFYNDKTSKVNLLSEYKQIYYKCTDRGIKCNKGSLDDSYNNYLKYVYKLDKLKKSEKCIFIMHEVPNLYVKLKPFYNMVNTSNNFLDFYINDFYECLKNNRNNNTYTLLRENIAQFDKYSEEYKNTYFDLKNKYNGNNTSLKNKIKYVMDYMN